MIIIKQYLKQIFGLYFNQIEMKICQGVYMNVRDK